MCRMLSETVFIGCNLSCFVLIMLLVACSPISQIGIRLHVHQLEEHVHLKCQAILYFFLATCRALYVIQRPSFN